MKSDVVVIGGGVAGLATAALLAREGKSVVVLEKGNQPGGRAYTYAEKGFTLNYGPHAVYNPDTGPVANVIGRLGCAPLAYGRPDPATSFWSDGDRLAAISDKVTSLLTTGLFPLASRVQLGKLMLGFRTAKVDRLGDLTYGEWVKQQTGDERVRRFAFAFGTLNTYTRPSAELSAKFLLQHVQRTLFSKEGVGYMSGGWSSMYRAFIDVLTSNGGRLITGARAGAFELNGPSVTAVVAAGERYEADAFVCALAPQDAPALAPQGSPLAADLARWANVQDVRALCIDLGFSRRVRTESTLVFDIERDLYYSLHSEVTPDLAPEGAQMLHAMAYLSADDSSSDAALARRKAELTDGLDRWFAGWREATVVERVLPNVRVASLRRTPEQTDANAVPLRVPSAENLYFAGDARDVPYVLADISLASAMEVADAIVAAPATIRAAEAIPA